jgi:FMN phosphatase YigB (HAD superfamily)
VIEAVLFDVDGTLVDHRAAAQAALDRLIERVPNPTLSPGRLRDVWFMLEREHMSEYLEGECSFAEQRRRRLRQFIPLLGQPVPMDDAELDSWFSDNYLRFYEDAWDVFPDVRNCLGLLQRMPTPPLLGVITNGDRDQQTAKLGRCNLLPTVGQVLTPSELGTAKPARGSFLGACAHLDLNPERTVYVGDSFEDDALAAQEAGLIGVWLDRGSSSDADAPAWHSGPETLPVCRIRSLAELPALIGSARGSPRRL